MLGFHRRTRSLIPVRDLNKYDVKVDLYAAEEEDDCLEMAQDPPKADQRQLTLVYIVFLAQAIMASSLRTQLQMLTTSDDSCGNLSSSYLQSILDCAYAFGATAGFFHGYASDRVGRRRVALVGLLTMSLMCLCMGFAVDLASCAIVRFGAGIASSAVVVTTLTMIGDLSQNAADRVKNLARLPLVALCGSIGPIVQSMIAGSAGAGETLWDRYPMLSSQIACGSLVFLIALVAYLYLEETLPLQDKALLLDPQDMDSEKAAFLGQVLIDESAGCPSISVVDFSRAEAISISHFIQAPYLLVLLASFSLLSLHASTFDVLLPHLGNSSTESGGMGISMSCSSLSFSNLTTRLIAGMLVLHIVPKAVASRGLLQPYRLCAFLFPAVYVATPVLALVVAPSSVATALTSTVAIVTQHALAGSAQVLVTLFMLNAAPDAFSTGTVIGLMQVASLFKALAVGVSGMSYYLGDDLSITTTNYALWTCLALFGAAGAALAWFVRERPRVEMDFPSEVLCWETCYDAEGMGAV